MREFPSDRLEGAALVGAGLTAEVFAWSEGLVVKLFHEWVAPARIEREFRIGQAVCSAGMRAPGAHELVRVGGRIGIVFERVAGRSMLAAVEAKPWRLFAAARELADLQHEVHGCRAPGELPTQRERIAGRIAEAGSLEAGAKEAALRGCAALPDGDALCHGDIHPNNVIWSDGGWVIIDWAGASRGNPVGDIACTSRLLRFATLPEACPGFMHWLLRCSRGLLHRTYLARALKRCGAGREELEPWEGPLAAAAAVWKEGRR